jgi:hypothetical protein
MSPPSPPPPPPSPSLSSAQEGLSRGQTDIYGVPPKGFLVVSMDIEEEEDWKAPDTSQDEEFTHKRFDKLIEIC